MNTESPSNKARLASLLKSVMTQYGWSQNELGRQIGASPNSASQWVNPKDNTMPSSKSLDLILKVVALLPASNEFSWIKTFDDLNSYLRGSDRAPTLSMVEVMRFVSSCEDLQQLFDLMVLVASRCKVLGAEITPSPKEEQPVNQ